MSNLLRVAMVETILSLHRRGWSRRRIAQELGIDRGTVARHLGLAARDSKPAVAPLGSDAGDGGPKPAVAPLGSDAPADEPEPAPASRDAGARERGGRTSECEPFRDAIRAKLDLGLSAQRIFQDLTADHGFAGSYYSVRRFVARLAPKHDLPFRRIECGPGEEAQVDFGTGAPVVGPDGKRRRTHVLRVVLSHSRKGYSEAVFRQTTDDFVRCLEDAFRHFGGVPRRLVLDNLRAAVAKADWFDPELNPQVRSFAEYYGTVPLPTRPYTPRHKGKVERGIAYVRENALRGRTFASPRTISARTTRQASSVRDRASRSNTFRSSAVSGRRLTSAAITHLLTEVLALLKPSIHELRGASGCGSTPGVGTPAPRRHPTAHRAHCRAAACAG